MAQNDKANHFTHDFSDDQIQSLLATSTGFIDAYAIPVFGDAPILLPQNMILSAMNVPPHSRQVEWHDKVLPTYIVHNPTIEMATALVVEGDSEETRFAILCDHMPDTLRLRISEVRDLDKPMPKSVYQYVEVDKKTYQIPHIQNIQHRVFRVD